MSLHIIDIKPHDSEESLLLKWKELENILHKEQFPRDPLSPDDVWIQRLRVRNVGIKRFHKAIYSSENDNIIAVVGLKYYTEESHKYKENKHLLELELNFLKEFKDDKLILELLSSTLEEVNLNKRLNIVESCNTHPRVWDLLEGLGASVSHIEGINRVYLDKIDWDLMEDWLVKGREIAKKESIELIHFSICPKNILEKFTALVTDILSLLPLDDAAWTPWILTPKRQRQAEEERKEIGFEWNTMVTKEKDGNLSGLTEVINSPTTPHWVSQDLTGVIPKYRGRGLGKWLKAEMLFYIKQNLPKTLFIQTSNAPTNAPMMSINERMGFKTIQLQKCQKIELDKLLESLETITHQ